MSEDVSPLYFTYRFGLRDGGEKAFTLRLDPRSLALMDVPIDPWPAWTKLDFHQCANCPLDINIHPHCPVAVSLTGVVDSFQSSKSYEEVDVTVETPDRTFTKHTALQEGLSSMVGIYMVTSGCPIMAKLKPMVRFHLPFATEDETKYRVLSMYLMAQYFNYAHGKAPDWDMKHLVSIYDDVRQVNKGFADRLANIHVEDASLNAVVNLDCFAMSVTFSLGLKTMDELEELFKGYI